MQFIRAKYRACGLAAVVVLLGARSSAAQVQPDGEDTAAPGATSNAMAPSLPPAAEPRAEAPRATVAPGAATQAEPAVARGVAPSPAAAATREQARGLSFPVRLGVGVTPIVGYSGLTAGYGDIHTPDNGSWVPVDVAPAIRIWKSLAVELGVSAMIPIHDAWGFPSFRLAATPALRVDGSLLYARVGVPFMFGDGTRFGLQAAAGITVRKPFYVGIAGFGSLSDLLFGLGLEAGVRFDDLRLVW
jgi:hypothetical protein